MIKKEWLESILVKLGNSKNIFFTLTNSEDQAIDLTGATIYFTVKKAIDIEEIDVTDTNALLTKTITDVTPLEWKFTVSITPTDTETLWLWDFSYDCKVVRSESSQHSTPVWVLTIAKVVTQR